MTHAFSIKEAFSYGWQQTKKNFGTFFLIVVGVFVVSGIFSFFSEEAKGGGIQIVSFIIQLLIGLGLTQAVLKIYKGETPSLQDFIPSRNILWEYLITTVVYLLGIIVGLVLLIVPGIYLCLKYQFALILVVDKKLKWKAALKESARLTEGKMWKLFGFALLGILLNIVGMALLFVGMIVTAPIVMMAYIYVYKKLLGEIGGETEEVKETKAQEEQTIEEPVTEEEVKEEATETIETKEE